MFKPKKLKAKDAKYCTNCYGGVDLEPHVKTMQAIPEKNIFIIDFWYCPDCGLVHYFEDLTRLVEKN